MTEEDPTSSKWTTAGKNRHCGRQIVLRNKNIKESFAQKETPFAERKPEDAIFGGVSIFYTILNIGLYSMMIWNLKFLLLRHLIPMYMTVSLMVIDTQDMRAVRKRAFPARSRSF